MFFQDTRPAPMDGGDPHAEFRVSHPRERLALLRQLRDGAVPLAVTTPGGTTLTVALWAVDDERGRVSLTVDGAHPALEALVAADEAVAVAYLDSVKLQFDLEGLVLVRGAAGVALQATLPQAVYRFQRRASYRVRTLEQHAPVARLRHPQIAEMQLALRVLDVSLGGCSLFLPDDVPPFEPGLQLSGVAVQLDADTRFTVTLVLHHVTAILPAQRGLRLGCEWSPLPREAEHALQRWIDQTQKRRRLLSLR